jgi:hypothetical protein
MLREVVFYFGVVLVSSQLPTDMAIIFMGFALMGHALYINRYAPFGDSSGI